MILRYTYIHINTINQLKIATTLFCTLPKINWFTASNICNQNVDYLKNNISETEDWCAARNIRDVEAFLNAKKVVYSIHLVVY